MASAENIDISTTDGLSVLADWWEEQGRDELGVVLRLLVGRAGEPRSRTLWMLGESHVGLGPLVPLAVEWSVRPLAVAIFARIFSPWISVARLPVGGVCPTAAGEWAAVGMPRVDEVQWRFALRRRGLEEELPGLSRPHLLRLGLSLPARWRE